MEQLSKQQQSKLQELLRQQKESLESLLTINKDTSNPVKLDQQAIGRVSRIDAIQQQKMASANRASQQQTLKQTLLALKKFDLDDYGFCEECDSIICYERLLIKPESSLCITCQTALETH